MSVKISVVIPVFNEEDNISILYDKLKTVLGKISENHEIVFINDGSTDSTARKLKSLRKKDKKVKYITFSRNFGHMSALDAGLKYASGERIAIIDADLQDPPEAIIKMYKKSLEGYNVVYGIKTKRKEGAIKRFLFSSFYKTLNKISSYKMPLNAGTFSIIDSRITSVLRNLPERNKYFSGLRAWVGFKQTGVVYKRSARTKGKPSSLKKLFKLALDGFFSFSYIPLKAASFFGFIFASIAFIMIIFVIVGRIFFKLGIVGWASTLSAILLIGGVQLITLGIIGEYLARIYDQVKNRPEYIISEKAGLK